jgi:RNA polymerase sigma-70 factor (ECF subfamily)
LRVKKKEDLGACDDEGLLARFLAGSEDAFAELVIRYEKPLVRFLMRYLSDQHAAEEVYQEAFMRVYNNAARFEEGRKFKTWLYTIALNLARTESARERSRPPMLAIDAARAKSGESEPLAALLPAKGQMPEERASEKEEAGIVKKAVMELSDRHREVFIMCHYEHLSYDEISETLNRPVGTIKSQMHYAIRELREKLSKVLK